MKRIIFFGCSLTYGHGLPDCIIPPYDPGPKPSKFSWSYIVSKYLQGECINLSEPGSSNKKIWNNILNFNYHKDDIVFIQWTFSERSALIKKNKVINISPWNQYDEEYFKNWYDPYDSRLMTKLYIQDANSALEKKKIKFYNLVAESCDKDVFKLKDRIVEHIPIYIMSYRKNYDKALDNEHPGVECNAVYAKKILNFLDIPNDIEYHKPNSIVDRIRKIFRKKLC